MSTRFMLESSEAHDGVKIELWVGSSCYSLLCDGNLIAEYDCNEKAFEQFNDLVRLKEGS